MENIDYNLLKQLEQAGADLNNLVLNLGTKEHKKTSVNSSLKSKPARERFNKLSEKYSLSRQFNNLSEALQSGFEPMRNYKGEKSWVDSLSKLASMKNSKHVCNDDLNTFGQITGNKTFIDCLIHKKTFQKAGLI